MNTAHSGLQHRTLPPLRWGAILIGLAVPISVALDNLLLAFLLLGALLNARAIGQIALHHPVARAAWLLFGMLAIGTLYGATPLREAAGTLGKYIDLAFVPLFMLLLSDDSVRLKAQYAFLAAMAATLLLSYMIGGGVLHNQPWVWGGGIVDDPAVFHSRITHNNMMAFAVFLALLRLRAATSFGARAGWGAFASLGTVNVLFMVQGRTGYLILLLLLAWFVWSTLARGKKLNSRHAAVLLLMLATLASAAYQLSPRLHERAKQVVTGFQTWVPNQGKSSTGQRLDFYYNTLQIVQQQPAFGVGTGGFPAAFAQQVQGTSALPTQNPHNEYLMVAAQTGIVGLALLLYLFYTLWRTAPRLPTAFEQDAARGLVLAYLVNCTFNSALTDHSDGLFFAFMTAMLFANLRQEMQRD